MGAFDHFEMRFAVIVSFSLLWSASALASGPATTVFTVTAYCACKACTGYNSGGPTASGAMPRQGVTVAAPRSIRFGTILDIEGVGRRVVQDRLAMAYDNRIDVFFRSHVEARRFGTRRLRVTGFRPN